MFVSSHGLVGLVFCSILAALERPRLVADDILANMSHWGGSSLCCLQVMKGWEDGDIIMMSDHINLPSRPIFKGSALPEGEKCCRSCAGNR